MAFFIFLRETLEASVIIAVLLQVMNRTMPGLKRQGELSDPLKCSWARSAAVMAAVAETC